MLKRSKATGSRQPITLEMMHLLKALIRKLNISNTDRGLLWAVCTIAFAGAFRIHELLCKTEAVFDPLQELLTEDITQSTNSANRVTLHVKLKCPKEAKNSTPTIVDIYQSDSATCPIAAFTKWHNRSEHKHRTPIFKWQNGTPLTGKKFNTYLKNMLHPYIDQTKGKFVSHSFRIGLASTLGTLGYGDEDIQAAGRWSSRAFQAYLKLKRTQRANMGKVISTLDVVKKR